MRVKLEAIANVAVIVVALAAGYIVLVRYLAAYRTPRSVSAGDLLPAIPSLDWGQRRHTLVLALNTGCHFCEQSVPFYQKLASAQQPIREDLEVVAVFPNDLDMVRRFMTRENLRIRSVSAVPLDKLRVEATPTIILVNSSGRVERSWFGTLTSRQELDVLKVALLSPLGCYSGEVAALQAGGKESCDSVTKGQSKN